MTVSTTIATKTYDGDGATVAFPTGFSFFSATDIEVVERVITTGVETVKALTTDYTVSGGEGAAGTVTALSAPPATVSWTIRRVLSETQETDLPVAGSLPSDAVEQMVDRTVMMVQQHSEQIGRALAFPKTDSDTLSPVLPNSVDRANKFLKFGADGSLGLSGGTTSVELGFADGSAAAPAVTFAADADNGLYRIGDNEVGFAIGGSKILQYDLNGLVMQNGSPSNPAISTEGDRDTGIAWDGADGLRFISGGEVNLEVNNGSPTVVNFLQILGRATGFSPRIGATGADSNIDIELTPAGSGVLHVNSSGSWTANGSAAITITNVGPTGIGNATISQWFTVKDNAGTLYYIPAWK